MLQFFASLRIRLAAFFGVLVLALALGVSYYVEHLAAEQITRASGERLDAVARGMARTLSVNLNERLREIELLSRSPTIRLGDWHSDASRQRLNEVAHSFTPYAWLGLTDAEGTVVVAADGLLEGADVSSRTWFQVGRERLFIGDVHKAILLAKVLRSSDDEDPLRFVDFAAPVYDDSGLLRGVVASHLYWAWVEAVVARGLPEGDASEDVEVFVFDDAGNLLHPARKAGMVEFQADLGTSRASRVLRWSDGDNWLTARAFVESPTSDDIAWQVVLRQPLDVALAPVIDLRDTLQLVAVPVAVVCMVMAYLLAVRFSRPVETLVETARRIAAGDESADFPKRSTILELRRLGAALQTMTATLLQRRGELEASNQQLELKVEKRTAELQEANRKLEALSSTDALTGLANRRRFDEVLAQEWARAQRGGTPLAVLLIDLDHFKQYNDHLGHPAGDGCLRGMGSLLQQQVRRAGELAARYGGEEFVVVLSDATLDHALTLAESIRAALQSEAWSHPTAPSGQVSASIGVASCVPSSDLTPAGLLEAADQALYRAKAAGRNRVES